jgi:host factor-I protein
MKLTTGARMAAERTTSLQDIFLDHVRKNNVPVMMFLVNGVKLQGYVTRFDAYSIQLTREGQSQVVYKRAISTLSPGVPISLHEQTSEG